MDPGEGPHGALWDQDSQWNITLVHTGEVSHIGLWTG